ncbi:MULTISPECIES: hypothetical protein [Pantoea]|uniref:hypothetical protein n=1 Tax=Pantoea TaxID=53335 RepID=UPI000FD78C96|nr:MULTISPECIES: hypothetical protein [Pantoea]
MQLHGMTYEDLCDAGYLGTDAEQVKALRRSVVAEILGSTANACLRDIGAFSASFLQQTRRGPGCRCHAALRALTPSGLCMKHILPAQALCSIMVQRLV